MAKEESVRVQQADEVTVLDYILDGLEAELALERELGVRFVDCDRSVLTVETVAEVRAPSSAPPGAPPSAAPVERPPAAAVSAPVSVQSVDFVFLHDKPLSPAGEEMMAKIVTTLGRTAETAPIVVEPPIPKAKVYVILGGLALKKFQPKLKAVPGQWVKTEKGAEVLVTYSPEYILRFKEVTPAVKKLKQDMWVALKGVLRRL